MASELKIIGRRLAVAACAGALGLAGFATWATPQDPESGSRQIYPEEFIGARPARAKAARTTASRRARRADQTC